MITSNSCVTDGLPGVTSLLHEATLEFGRSGVALTSAGMRPYEPLGGERFCYMYLLMVLCTPGCNVLVVTRRPQNAGSQ